MNDYLLIDTCRLKYFITRVWNVMARRIALAKQYGCHGVDPDNVDGYTNNPGFQLTYDNQITFNRFLANGQY